MSSGNKNLMLNQAKRNKSDEFFTQLSDIENELNHYKDYFKNKVVYCNCDEPKSSNFIKFFYDNFHTLGLRKLISTCFKAEEQSLFTNEPQTNGIYFEYDGTNTKSIDKQKLSQLRGNGDFRSQECIEILKKADIVVTNPPFSMFREYLNQLIDFKKNFLIIGNQNALTYKEVFTLIKHNRVWLGYGFKGHVGYFLNSHYENTQSSSSMKDGLIRVPGVVWYTNLPNNKRNSYIKLEKKYTENSYSKFDHYPAINVDKVSEIPLDYYELMGVPITFLHKFNPKQYKIIDAIGRYSLLKGPTPESKGKYLTNVNGKKKYTRLIIKKIGDAN